MPWMCRTRARVSPPRPAPMIVIEVSMTTRLPPADCTNLAPRLHPACKWVRPNGLLPGSRGRGIVRAQDLLQQCDQHLSHRIPYAGIAIDHRNRPVDIERLAHL